MAQMSRKMVHNPLMVAPPLKGYYSNAVKVSAGPLLFIAGQVAIDREGRIVGKGDLRAQAVQALENIKAISAPPGESCTELTPMPS